MFNNRAVCGKQRPLGFRSAALDAEHALVGVRFLVSVTDHFVKFFQSKHRVGIFFWVLFVAWMGAIFTLSSMSSGRLEPWMLRIPHWDKVCHTGAFAAGALILTLALRTSTAMPMHKIVPLVILVISIFGATDEWHQLYTPSRSGGDVFHWPADTLGATGGR